MDAEHGCAVGVVQHEGTVQGAIYITKDAGKNWSLQHLAGDRSGSLTKVKFVDTRVGWAVGEGVILHTIDGGEHWTEQRHEKGDYLFDIESVSAVNLWIVGGNGLLLHTTDGGKSWKLSKLPPDFEKAWFSQILFLDDHRGWLFGNNGTILATTNGGESWQLESKSKSGYLRASTSTSRALFTAGNDGVILRRIR
jgi:photosystem II stability/assembly factor-like uncharacterized protein